MLTLALVFLVLAIIAAVLGFSGIVATSALVFRFFSMYCWESLCSLLSMSGH